MALSVVQSKHFTIDQGGSFTVALNSSVTAGNSLMINIGYYTGAGTLPTAITGGGTTAVKKANNHVHSQNYIEGWLVENAAGGTANIVITADCYMWLDVIEVSGAASSSSFDSGTLKDNVSVGGSATPNITSTAAAAQADEIYIASFIPVNGAAYTIGQPSGWTGIGKEEDGVNHEPGATAYKIVAVTTTQTATWSDSPADPYCAAIWSIKQSTGGGSNLAASISQGATMTATERSIITSSPTAGATLTARWAIMASLTEGATLLANTGLSSASTQGAAVTANWALRASISEGATLSATERSIITSSPTAGAAISATVTGKGALASSLSQGATVTGTFATSISAAIVGGGRIASPSYTTSFPTNETPLSEGGLWRTGQTHGLDWTDPVTSGGNALNNQDNTGGFDDSIACLASTDYAPDQSAEVTIGIGSSSGFHEAEALVRWKIELHWARGYEVNLARDGTYCEVVRWNGPRGFSFGDGAFDIIANVSVAAPQTGDRLRAEAVGNVISIYINDVFITSVVDNTFKDGAPGVGLYRDHAGPASDYFISAFTARSLNNVNLFGMGALASSLSQGASMTGTTRGTIAVAISVSALLSAAGFSLVIGASATSQGAAVAASLVGNGSLACSTSQGATVSASFAGAGALASSTTQGATLSATLIGIGSLASNTSQGATATPNIVGIAAVTASITEGAAVSAALGATGFLSAACVANCSVSAPGQALNPITSSTSQGAALTATLLGSGALACSSSCGAAVSATLSANGALAASLAGASTVTASLIDGTGTGASIGGGAALAATLLATGAIASSGNCGATLTGTITGRGALTISGTAGAALAGALSGTGALLASSTAGGSASGALQDGASQSASLPGGATLAGSLQSNLGAAAALSGGAALIAGITGIVTGTAAPSAGAALAGTIEGSVAIFADLPGAASISSLLSGSGAMQSSLLGSALTSGSLQRLIVADLPGSAFVTATVRGHSAKPPKPHVFLHQNARVFVRALRR